MKRTCFVCGSEVEDVSGICPVCGSMLSVDQQGAGNDASQNASQQPKNNPFSLNQQEAQQNQQPQQPTPNQGGASYGGAPTGQYGAPGQAGGSSWDNPYVQPVYQQGMGGQPYNYNDPYTGKPKPANKKALFGIIGMILAIIGLCLICSSVIPLVVAVAAIALAIVAFLRREPKGFAITAIIIGAIVFILGSGTTIMDLSFRMVSGTSFTEFCKQMMEVVSENVHSIEGTTFIYNNVQYTFYYDGTYVNSAGASGTYSCTNYGDQNAQEDMVPSVLYAMSQEYTVKEVTLVEMYSNGAPEELILVVPDGFAPGDWIYVIEGDPTSYDVRNLVPVITQQAS